MRPTLLPLLASTLLSLPLAANAFVFSYTAPTSCDNLTILWEGGTPPFSLLITPSLDVARNYSIPSSAFSTSSNRGNFTIQLDLAPTSSFLLTMSDSTGFGTGGTSALLVTGASTTNTKCNTAGPPLGFNFYLPEPANQCKPFQISWDANATRPVEIWGLIPLGQTFEIGPVNGVETEWTVNIATGTSFFLVLADAAGHQGGTSSIQSVGSSDDSSCINANSPSSTVNSQPAQTSVSSGNSPGGSSAGITASNTAPTSSATSGASNSGTTTSHTGPIVGGVVGGILALVALLLLAGYFWQRHRRRSAALHSPGLGTYKRTAFGTSGGGGMIDLLPNPSHPDLPRSASYGPGGVGGGGAYPSPQQYEPVPFLVPPLEEDSVYRDGSTDGGRTGTTGFPNPFQDSSSPSARTPRTRTATAPTSTFSSTTTGTEATHGHAPSGYYIANPNSRPNSGLYPSAAGAAGRGGPSSKRAEARLHALPERRYVVHTDAGSVLDSEDPADSGDGEGEDGEPVEPVVVELPPAYDPSFVSSNRRRPRPPGAGAGVAGAGEDGTRLSVATDLGGVGTRTSQASGDTVRPGGQRGSLGEVGEMGEVGEVDGLPYDRPPPPPPAEGRR